MVALVIVTTPRFYGVHGFVLAAVMIPLAVLGWTIWTRFGRGTRWTYYLVLATASIALVANLVLLGVPKAMAWLDHGQGNMGHILTAIGSAAVLGILMLPATRRHFRGR
jgi:asparagine N-glycosylation enzyme membrane subunit Stt3